MQEEHSDGRKFLLADNGKRPVSPQSRQEALERNPTYEKVSKAQKRRTSHLNKALIDAVFEDGMARTRATSLTS
jgi:hypothetical protein